MQALSPLDGRYRAKVEALATYFSEEALNRARLEVEVRYFIALSKEAAVKQLPKLSASQEKALLSLIKKYTETALRMQQAISSDEYDQSSRQSYKRMRVLTNRSIVPISHVSHLLQSHYCLLSQQA